MKKKIAILGSTGSIGKQALDVLSHYPEYYEIVAISARQNIDLLEKQADCFKPSAIAVTDCDRGRELKARLDGDDIKIYYGEESLVHMIEEMHIDMVLVAVVGISGLKVTLASINKGIDIALANKETIVAGGQLVMETARHKGCSIIPVDSEHSAIFQCINSCKNHEEIKKVHLTASGGPFRGYTKAKLGKVTVEDALNHPNWKMGKKVTIDSATLMNKGLEVIEAKWLFDMEPDQINVIIHPQSIIHSMVEYIDGAVIAQLGRADMRIPILYAFTFPRRFPTMTEPLDLFQTGSLTFERPDIHTFPCLQLAYSALTMGGSMPVVLNAANEVAVAKFLREEISFNQIPVIIEKAMGKHKILNNPKMDDIIYIDKQTRLSIG